MDVEDEDESLVRDIDLDSEGVVNNPEEEEDGLHDVELLLNLDGVQEVVLLDEEIDVEGSVGVKDESVVVEGDPR